MHLKRLKHFIYFILLFIIYLSCSKMSGPAALFRKLSPHDAYGQKLKDAGLEKSAMGSAWLLTAPSVLNNALTISIPYKENGYFPADKPVASALKFAVKRGEKLHISLTKKPATSFNIYMDLFQLNSSNVPELVSSADTTGALLNYEVKKTGNYILRLQPELLASGEYTLTIIAGPSLSFPVSASGKPYIGSFFGDGRDEGARLHEGIDIFSPKGTPAIAAKNGIVERVTENKLGGLVVFMRPDEEDYTLYYAHLGKQLVHDGQAVKLGDTIGLIDNTGNAKNTPSHLHFGIYTFDGAVDPLPFVNREVKHPGPINTSPAHLNTTMHSIAAAKIYLSNTSARELAVLPAETIVTITAETGDQYKVTLPNGQTGYASSSKFAPVTGTRSLIVKSNTALYEDPDSLNSPRKAVVTAGSHVKLLGRYDNYQYVNYNGGTGWIKRDL